MIGMDEILMTLVLERIDDKFSKKKKSKHWVLFSSVSWIIKWSTDIHSTYAQTVLNFLISFFMLKI